MLTTGDKYLDRVRGSHHVLRHPTRLGFVIFRHPKGLLGKGFIAAIRKQAGVQPMRYPVAIEPSTVTPADGVIVPDLPGWFSADDITHEALAGAEEAAAAWLEAALDSGEPIPSLSSPERLRTTAEYQGWRFGVITLARAAPDCQITPMAMRYTDVR